VAILSFATLLACSSDPPKSDPVPPCDSAIPAPSTAPAVEALVQNGDTYDPITDGMALPRHYGPQGGSHFYVWSRVFFESKESVEVAATLLSDADGATIAGGFETFTACETSWTKTKRLTVFFQQEPVTTGMTLHVKTSQPASSPLELTIPITISQP
jgi:hypothetical protein